MSDRGLIYDWYPAGGSPVVDITGTQVGYSLQFSPDDDPNNYSPLPLASVPAVLQAIQAVTVTAGGIPLSALSLIQNIPKGLQTVFSSAFALSAQSTINSELNTALGPGNFTASSVTQPPGKVRARVVPGGPLLLDLWASGVSLDVSNVTLFGFSGLSFHVTFDAELFIVAFVQWPFIQAFPTIALFNASIIPTGKTNLILQLGQMGWDLRNENTNATYGYQLASPFDLSQYENQINYALVPPPSSQTLSPILNAFAAIGSVAIGFGFGASQPPPAPVVQPCVPVTDPGAPSPLTFQLAKPIDPPPVAYDPLTQAGPGSSASANISPNWILGGPTISVSQTQVLAGGTYGVKGTGFPQSNIGEVGWSNTCSGPLVQSDIEWQIDGQSQPTASVQQPNPLLFVAPITPHPSDTFHFQVRNRDILTTTPWSDPVSVQAVGSVQLVLNYLSRAPHARGGGGGSGTPFLATQVVGTATVGPTGIFSQIIVIPGAALPCTATLFAQLLGQQIAVTQVNIVDLVQPVLSVINPVNGLAVSPPTGTQGYMVTVHGEGFLPPPPAGPPAIVTVYIDHVTGSGNATAQVASDGTFTSGFVCPTSLLPGNHSLIGIENESQQTIQTTLQLVIQEIPQ